MQDAVAPPAPPAVPSPPPPSTPAAATATSSPTATIEEGAWVVLQMGDGRNFFAQAQRKGTMRLGRTNVCLGGLLGVPYGTVLEVPASGRLVPLPGTTELYEDLTVGDLDGGDFTRGGAPAAMAEYDGSTRDNRDYGDTNTAQRMTMEEIEKLKKTGASGQAIIQALAQNSDTWDKKTAFAKQKWTKKKAHKYVVRVRAVAGNATNVVQALFTKSQLVKSSAIRPDSVAQLLSFGNVFAGAQVVVVDSYSGVLVGAVLERMGGHGRVMHLFSGLQPHNDHVKYFNMPKEQLAQTLITYPASGIAELEKEKAKQEEEKDGEAEAMAVGGEEGAAPASTAPQYLTTAEEEAAARESGKYKNQATDEFDRQRWLTHFEKKRTKLRDTADGRRMLLDGADCLVAACRQDPAQVIPRLLPFLRDGAAFAVYCEYMEPLVQLHSLLADAGMARLQLLNTWWREYQILPGRSHPAMNMSADGGYLLTGIKVTADDKVESSPVPVDEAAAAENGVENGAGEGGPPEGGRRASIRSNDGGGRSRVGGGGLGWKSKELKSTL